MKPTKKDVQPLEVINSLQEYLMKHGEQNTACLLMYEAMCCIKSMVAAGEQAEPVKVPSNVEATQPTETALGDKGDIVGWLRRRSDWPMVSIPGKLAGEIADHIESLSEKDADHLRDATKMIEPVRVPGDDELLEWAGQEQFFLFCSEDEFLDIARALLAKYSEQAGKCSEAADIDYKAMYEQMCERCDALDKALADERNAVLDEANNALEILYVKAMTGRIQGDDLEPHDEMYNVGQLGQAHGISQAQAAIMALKSNQQQT